MLVRAVTLQIMRGGEPPWGPGRWNGPVFAANALAVTTMSHNESLTHFDIIAHKTKDGFLWHELYLAFLTSTNSHVHTCAVYICRFAQSRVCSKPTVKPTRPKPLNVLDAHYRILLTNGTLSFPSRLATHGIHFHIRLPAVTSGAIFLWTATHLAT
jgi:hypothetical protein